MYLELWDALLQSAAPAPAPAPAPGTAPDAADVEGGGRDARVRGLVFDELMTSFADMFKALDLEYTKAYVPRPPGAPARVPPALAKLAARAPAEGWHALGRPPALPSTALWRTSPTAVFVFGPMHSR